jgi:hypothetical protein
MQTTSPIRLEPESGDSTPKIVCHLNNFYFSSIDAVGSSLQSSALMDCLLPSIWSSDFVRERVSIEQRLSPNTLALAFFTVERYIMKYSFSPDLKLPANHPVFVFDDSLTVYVRDLYMRVKRDVVLSHKKLRTFSSEAAFEYFVSVAKHFCSRCLLTSSLFLKCVENNVFGERFSAETDDAILHVVLPFAAKHARIRFAGQLQDIVPSIMRLLIIHPLPVCERDARYLQIALSNVSQMRRLSIVQCRPVEHGIVRVLGKRTRSQDDGHSAPIAKNWSLVSNYISHPHSCTGLVSVR